MKFEVSEWSAARQKIHFNINKYYIFWKKRAVGNNSSSVAVWMACAGVWTSPNLHGSKQLRCVSHTCSMSSFSLGTQVSRGSATEGHSQRGQQGVPCPGASAPKWQCSHHWLKQITWSPQTSRGGAVPLGAGECERHPRAPHSSLDRWVGFQSRAQSNLD